MTAPEPPPDPPGLELQAMHAEFSEHLSNFKKFSRKFREAARAADLRNKELQTKVEDLEAQNLTRAFEIRELERENTVLQEVVDEQDLKLVQVASERDDIRERLERAEKTIQDLLAGRKNKAAVGAGTEDRSASVALRSLHKHPKRETTIGSDDDSTARPEDSSTESASAHIHSSNRTDSASNTNGGQPISGASTSSHTTTESASTLSVPTSGHVSKGKKRVQWYLELNKIPATCQGVWHGPIPFDVLEDQLVLDEITVVDVGRMETTPGYDTRIVFEADRAFVYRPIVLEGPNCTLFLGWGDSSLLRNTEAQLAANNALPYKMFIYPPKEDSGWFFVGTHTLKFSALHTIWSRLSAEDKEALLVELRDRNPAMSASQFKRDVREGRLVQCCIQLDSHGDKADSLEFLREYGLLAGDHAEDEEFEEG